MARILCYIRPYDSNGDANNSGSE